MAQPMKTSLLPQFIGLWNSGSISLTLLTCMGLLRMSNWLGKPFVDDGAKWFLPQSLGSGEAKIQPNAGSTAGLSTYVKPAKLLCGVWVLITLISITNIG